MCKVSVSPYEYLPAGRGIPSNIQPSSLCLVTFFCHQGLHVQTIRCHLGLRHATCDMLQGGARSCLPNISPNIM